MIEYIALTNFFSFKERTEFSLKGYQRKAPWHILRRGLVDEH